MPGAHDGGQPGPELLGAGRKEPLGAEDIFGTIGPGEQDFPDRLLARRSPEDQFTDQRAAIAERIPGQMPPWVLSTVTPLLLVLPVRVLGSGTRRGAGDPGPARRP